MYDNDSPSFLALLIGDPLRTRRIGAIALLLATPLAAFAHAAHLGFATSILAAFCWAIAPIIALAIGNGDAFFLQHGRGRRRVLLTIIAGVLLALMSCVALAGLSDARDSTRRTITEAIGYGLLYLSATIAAARLIAILFGYGREYVSSRIMRMRDDDW